MPSRANNRESPSARIENRLQNEPKGWPGKSRPSKNRSSRGSHNLTKIACPLRLCSISRSVFERSSFTSRVIPPVLRNP
jgi:hypothetical protein